VKKIKQRFLARAARNGSRRDVEVADERLESMVSQLLDSEPEFDGEAIADAACADLLAARNGGSKAAGRTLREEEIESLLQRMVFSEQAFLKYSH
jgi:hypothetical protein